jgi:hypothetical protein
VVKVPEHGRSPLTPCFLFSPTVGLGLLGHHISVSCLLLPAAHAPNPTINNIATLEYHHTEAAHAQKSSQYGACSFKAKTTATQARTMGRAARTGTVPRHHTGLVAQTGNVPWRVPARGGSGGLTEEAARRAMAERMRRDGVQMQWGGGGSRWLAMTRL